MAQTVALLQALKKSLKPQGKTYVDVANTLGLTEASVKPRNGRLPTILNYW